MQISLHQPCSAPAQLHSVMLRGNHVVMGLKYAKYEPRCCTISQLLTQSLGQSPTYIVNNAVPLKHLSSTAKVGPLTNFFYDISKSKMCILHILFEKKHRQRQEF